jgi:predicted chitinase
VGRARFFDAIRGPLFPSLSQPQVDGLTVLLDVWERDHAALDRRWLAYALATAHHETGRTLQPVREGFARTDKGAIAAVTKLFRAGKIRRNYALPAENGRSYFGRGVVQITHPENYLRVGKALGLGPALYDDPSLALQPEVAARILYEGMIHGLFTGSRLADYFIGQREHWVEARKIVNGMDRAAMVAGYGQRYDAALAAARGES